MKMTTVDGYNIENDMVRQDLEIKQYEMDDLLKEKDKNLNTNISRLMKINSANNKSFVLRGLFDMFYLLMIGCIILNIIQFNMYSFFLGCLSSVALMGMGMVDKYYFGHTWRELLNKKQTAKIKQLKADRIKNKKCLNNRLNKLHTLEKEQEKLSYRFAYTTIKNTSKEEQVAMTPAIQKEIFNEEMAMLEKEASLGQVNKKLVKRREFYRNNKRQSY